MEPPAVTVVTVTRGRPERLALALDSVTSQDFLGEIWHYIVVDHCEATYTSLSAVPSEGHRGRVVLPTLRDSRSRSGPGRLAELRNYALGAIATPLVCFLDDDNTFSPPHISSLVATMSRTGGLAVHSERLLFHPDGRPYVTEAFPWVRDERAARDLYEEGLRRGIFERGSNVVHDRIDPEPGPTCARIVDMNAWLLDSDLMKRIKFVEDYGFLDWLYVNCEDSKLLREFVANGISAYSSGMPTLNYSLGGYSNDFTAPDIAWETSEARAPSTSELEAMRRFPPSWGR